MTAAQPLPSWSRALQGPEYRWFLSASTKLPRPLAYGLAKLRGRFNARHDRDWASLGLGHRHVVDQTIQGLRQFLPEPLVYPTLIERFETVAREEMEARALAAYGVDFFSIKASIAEESIAARPRNRGMVLITAHMETFILGIACLAQAGGTTHLVISEVSSHPQLHPAIREHFQTKYRGLQLHFNGGQFAPVESGLRHFYKALGRGDMVIVLADSPALPNSPGFCLPWLGQHRVLAQGALRMAEQTNSLVAAFTCRWNGGNQHAVSLSNFFDAQEIGMQNVAKECFSFLERRILERPGRWWASHLLPAYRVCSGGPNETSLSMV